MEASIIDLRYKMKDVHKALERNEIVKISYHRKLIGKIFPCSKITKKKVKDHPFFGMYKSKKQSVEEEMAELRKGRYDDL